MGRVINVALRMAIVQSQKKQKRIAALARMNEVRLSKIVRGYAAASPEERERLAGILGKSASDLFPQQVA